MARSPVDVYIDEWVYELLDLVEKTGAKRVLVDSLADLYLTLAIRSGFASGCTR